MLSQYEQLIKQRFTPSFQHQAHHHEPQTPQSVIQKPQIEPDVQDPHQQVTQYDKKMDTKESNWKDNDNREFRLYSLNKMLDVLTCFETCIYNESRSRNEYFETMRELQGGFKLVFEQIQKTHSE